MISSTIRSAIELYAKETLGERSGALTHSERVFAVARTLSSEYDEDILHAACFLHDINMDKPHPKEAARQAQAFLERVRFPEGKIPAVIHAIEEHGYYGSPASKEAFMLTDADQLDAMGVTGYGQFSEFTASPDEMERALESIERECLTVLKLSSSRAIAKQKIQNRKQVIALMRQEISAQGKGP